MCGSRAITQLRSKAQRSLNAYLLACGDGVCGEVIPAMKFFERDTETICDGDERIAAARLVHLSMRGRHNRSERDYETLEIADGVVLLQLIGSGNLLDGEVIILRDGSERFLWLDAVIAPLRAPVLRNSGDALRVERGHAFGKMEIKGLREC